MRDLPAMAPASTADITHGTPGCWAKVGDDWPSGTEIVCGRPAGPSGLCPTHEPVLRRWPPDDDRARLLEAS